MKHIHAVAFGVSVSVMHVAIAADAPTFQKHILTDKYFCDGINAGDFNRDGKGGATFMPHLIDDKSGVGVQVVAADVNGDGRPDILTVSKLGTFVFLNKGRQP
jgi:hypothetical protein